MRKERILIIDDELDIRDVLNLSLSEYYTIFAATNGKEGLEMVKTKNPDLIITDYNMPVMSGPEFCRHLRRDILLRHLPVIMLTGKGETRDMVTGIESGADDYLIKPFDPETLLARIRMILKRTIRSLDANPLTHLPGNSSIMEEFQSHIDFAQPFAVGYADLDKFKIYNDKYGFECGDEIIRALARILIDATQQFCGQTPLWAMSEGMILYLFAMMIKPMPSARKSLMTLMRSPPDSTTMKTPWQVLSWALTVKAIPLKPVLSPFLSALSAMSTRKSPMWPKSGKSAQS